MQITGTSWLSGLIDNKLILQTQGNNLSEMLENSKGKLDLNMQQGGIPGANLEEIAYKSINELKDVLGSAARRSFLKSNSIQQSGSNLNNFFASLTITKNQIHTKKALLQVNNKPANMSILYLRNNNNLTFTTSFSLDSKDPTLNELMWPVTCTLENWSLPKCGIVLNTVRENLRSIRDIKNK